MQLNRNANSTEIDLLSPEFAEKFACGKKCQKLGLYDSNFVKQETQLTSFFFTEEGRFFEFYGRLTRLNVILMDYRATSPVILKEYLSLMLNRKLTFDSLIEFVEHLEIHITEQKILAFSKSGFISPVSDRLSSTFLDDLIANLPKDWEVEDLKKPGDDWNANALTPDELWLTNFLSSTTPTTETIRKNWIQAKKHPIHVGSIVCSYSNNIFGLVTGIENNKVTLEVIAQAKMVVDGFKQYTHPGYLFTAPESFYFIKAPLKKSYPQSDIAPCNIEHFKRGQKGNKKLNTNFVLNK